MFSFFSIAALIIRVVEFLVIASALHFYALSLQHLSVKLDVILNVLSTKSLVHHQIAFGLNQNLHPGLDA